MNLCRFSVQSQADIRAITNTIKNDNPHAAAQWLSAVQEKCQRIASFPHMGRERSDLHSGLFGFPFGNYLIFYRVIPNGIEVARVIDGRRDIPTLFHGPSVAEAASPQSDLRKGRDEVAASRPPSKPLGET